MWAGITGVIIGLLIGGTAVAIWLKRRGGSGGTVASLKRENAQFREEVNEHFVQTAELINQLTDSYKAVFDHLSEGAEKLVEPDVVRDRMPQVTNEEVRLKRIGSPRPAEEADSAAAQQPEPTQADRAQNEESEDTRTADAREEAEDPSDDSEQEAARSASPEESPEELEKPAQAPDPEKAEAPSETKESEASGESPIDEDEKARRREP